MRKHSFPLILLALLLAGCATTGKKEQAGTVALLAETGAVTVTVNAGKRPDLGKEILGDESLAQRVSRITALFRGTDYPYTEANLSSVVLEGDLPSFAVKIALSKIEGLEKEDGYWMRGDGWKIGTLKGKRVLATMADWETEKARVEEGIPRMDTETEARIESADVGLWSERPLSFFRIADDVPQNVFTEMESVEGEATGENGSWILDAVFTMTDEKYAESLNKILRSAYVAFLRRSGEKIDVPTLQPMFTKTGFMLIIDGVRVPEPELAFPKI